MKFYKLSAAMLGTALFAGACNLNQTDDLSGAAPYPGETLEAGVASDPNDYYAKDNLDLQAVGALLERADDAEEFEYLLNSEDGINNLDLNGDGYADYIGVREFGDDGGGERGLSLFSMFGPELIQEIATIFFDRDGGDYPGARILMRGNEQIYGDDYYYETNWLERSLQIASYLFSDRDEYYASPYYYENYPDYYEPYPIVETPVYRTRIREYYPEPIFIRTSAPQITEIEIVSPYRGRTIERVYSKLAKPTREQIDFRRKNPGPPAFVPVKNGRAKEKAPKFKEKLQAKGNNFERPGRGNREKAVARGNPNGGNPNKGWKREEVKAPKPPKAERQNVRQQPVRMERPNVRQQGPPARAERPNAPRQGPPARAERPNMKPPKQDNPGRGNGGGNPGRGNGGGKGNGGGGGKGGGKKG